MGPNNIEVFVGYPLQLNGDGHLEIQTVVDRRFYLRSRRNNLLDINLTITLELVGELIKLQYVYLGSTCAKCLTTAYLGTLDPI